ncbi:acyl-CoA N-acyltransferase [Cantharellus anzutake]|uniref:acyl-CoA N-acyltransferase n=1 Tax=Cantharellus anzutake TaxID=1750568 RepID=UPI001906FBF7|nr:acyl-CoA N-acyltransferase [Cantharellus anzutake]KAF8331482.1 acyl-CoA N-acyltransferase [Cantharellus anzutake]
MSNVAGTASATSQTLSFTPDDKLELLFDPKLIPNDVKAALPNHLHIRPLSLTDYGRGHLSVLSVLTQTPDVGAAAWSAAFGLMRSTPNTYYAIAIVDKALDRVVGVGTVFMERKFLRGLGVVGHIEDIAVDKQSQGHKLGLRIIQTLTAISEGQGAYKTILNCSTDNIPFYQKCGYEEKEREMAKYATGVSKL